MFTFYKCILMYYIIVRKYDVQKENSQQIHHPPFCNNTMRFEK